MWAKTARGKMYSTDIEIVRSVVRGGGLKTRSRL